MDEQQKHTAKRHMILIVVGVIGVLVLLSLLSMFSAAGH